MLRECFQRFTSRLLDILEPDTVLLSGSKTHTFAHAIKAQRPGAHIVRMLHYAHREGAAAQAAELQRVRAELAR